MARLPEAGDPPVTPRCWLCGRLLGRKIEWHHPTPKSRGGRITVPAHPICHRAIHASFSNTELDQLERKGLAPAAQPGLELHALDRRQASGFQCAHPHASTLINRSSFNRRLLRLVEAVCLRGGVCGTDA